MSIEGVSVGIQSYEMAQLRISQLESENQTLREQLRRYEEQFASLNSHNTPPSSTKALFSGAASGDLVQQQEKNKEAQLETADKIMGLFEECQKLLAQAVEAEIMSCEDNFSFSSPLTTQESEIRSDSPENEDSIP